MGLGENVFGREDSQKPVLKPGSYAKSESAHSSFNRKFCVGGRVLGFRLTFSHSLGRKLPPGLGPSRFLSANLHTPHNTLPSPSLEGAPPDPLPCALARGNGP
jgi:hypothetical protein